MSIRSRQESGSTYADPVLLIVEDHASIRIEVGRILSAAFPGCKCILCGSGEEAARVARTQYVDAVLMDIALPGINGIEATRQIKAFAPWVPVVMLSAYGEDMFGPIARAAGASGYVQKDAMCNELVPVLVGLMKQPRKRTSA